MILLEKVQPFNVRLSYGDTSVELTDSRTRTRDAASRLPAGTLATIIMNIFNLTTTLYTYRTEEQDWPHERPSGELDIDFIVDGEDVVLTVSDEDLFDSCNVELSYVSGSYSDLCIILAGATKA